MVALAEREHVDRVVVGVAEALLPTYCKVCKRLGLSVYSTQEVFEIMTRKDLFKKKCIEYSVPTINGYDSDELEKAAYPVIVKPVDSYSSNGIRICQNRAELDATVEYALQFSKSKKYLIEEYMHGDEVVSYYVIQDGNPIFVGMCDRYIYKAKEDIVQLPTSYIFPSKHIDSYIQYSDSAVKGMIKGIGLKNGSIFFQCFVDDEGVVKIYESGYRLNGAQEHIIISNVSGIDAKEMYINYALYGKVSDVNLEPLSNPKHRKIACKLSPLVRTGKISKIVSLEEIADLPDVVSVNPSYNNGDTVTGEGTLKQIICRFFIVADRKDKLKEIIKKNYDLLDVLDEGGHSMLLMPFDTNVILEEY